MYGIMAKYYYYENSFSPRNGFLPNPYTDEKLKFNNVEEAQKWIENNEFMPKVEKISETRYRTTGRHEHGQYSDTIFYIQKRR